MAGLGPHNDFAPSGDPLRDQALLNEQVHLTVMLESATAFSHLDEIVATPGVDAVTLGPSDLAQELGVLGTPRQGAVIDEHRLRLIDAGRMGRTWRCWCRPWRRPSAGSRPGPDHRLRLGRGHPAQRVRHGRRPPRRPA